MHLTKILTFALTALTSTISIAQTSTISIAQTEREQPPNIVLIVADDLGYGELSCYGQSKFKTPNIDRIANEGIRFTQFYTGQAVCAPARCSLMMGVHQGHAFIRGNGYPKSRGKPNPKELHYPGQHPIPAENVTIAEYLKTKGYATAAIGKWGLGHFGTTGDPNQQGFDLFYGFACQWHAHNHYPRFLHRNAEKEMLAGNDRTLNGETYSQDKLTEVALEFIDAKKEGPFFLYLPFAIPHLSIQAPQASVDQYRGDIVEAEYEHKDMYLQHPEPRAAYAAMVCHMDRDIGKIMQRLRDHGIADNTLVMFTSDNGPTFRRLGGADSDYFDSSGEMRGRKGSLLEGGIRVPLVAMWPDRIKAGQVSDHVSAFWDILPTACEVANVEPTEAVDGISFLPTLLGKEQPKHEHLYWEFSAYGGQQAVRMGKWKAIRQKLRKNPDASFELYDLSADLGEANNVAGQNPEVIKKIKEICKSERTPSDLFPFPALDKN